MSLQNQNKPHISVAPMMDWTDRHCRYFLRLISPNTRLYTEMVTTGAIVHGDRERFLRFDESEHPIALQLGGSGPKDLAACACIGEEYGYDEINLNCGCPSDRVQNGAFGACLMKEPQKVAECIEAMQSAVQIPVTVKCRIGIDEQDSFEFLDNFVGALEDKGCKTFIIHARKAWLKGLSPRQNRDIPELNYRRVKEIKTRYPDLNIILNGGISTTDDILSLLCHPRCPAQQGLNDGDPEKKTTGKAGRHMDPVHANAANAACQRDDGDVRLDGVMVGREAYQNPYFLTEVEKEIFGNKNNLSRREIALSMIPYIKKQINEYDAPVKSITRHMIGLFHGQPGGRAWRQTLSTLPYQSDAKADIIIKALDAQKGNMKQAA